MLLKETPSLLRKIDLEAPMQLTSDGRITLGKHVNIKIAIDTRGVLHVPESAGY